ncbi:hypothetical protein I3843_02G168900 [Carya illinoinensis]|uniref:phosphoinositide phospholipase C n=1 Tax=Carya illinoinensis TaxID=32201 RepID=A0A8T1RFZ8_CARIL|nr:phosphoinositide phospholipase C 6-like [Carya illinoinensis]KAG6665897.1 hypothetical protein CIPAW_02G192300 [Carya illinoinensis]KAG7993242.1 hypothetical protein I3843_02G168900 [Carya illinoinensis]
MASYKYKMLGFSRKFKMNELGPPADVQKAFSKFAEGGDQMSASQLRRFLEEHQDEVESTVADADRIIKHVLHGRHEAHSAKQSLSLADFFHFLFLDDLNGPIKSQVHHDMTAPLSHYFIYTGHNSYLTGNQLNSDCSDVPLIKALQRGVRVIELDIWPNSTRDDVLVLHGRTLTTPVKLIKCLQSIKEYAFVKSPYPVIITLEDHLTRDLQDKVAKMLTQTFGEMLYYPQGECLAEFPSPESLKYRIAISTKPPKIYLESENSKDKGSSFNGEREISEESASGKETPTFNAEPEEEKNNSDPDDEDINGCVHKSAQEGAPEYKRLITIHAGKPKGSLKDALQVVVDEVRRLSLSEQALEKAASNHGTDVVRFTQKNILRVYPKGTRVTSSNYKPHIGWMHGAQMVAFNMQGHGKLLWLMQGMFRTNGECGYVKKPDFLMQRGPHNEVFNPKRTFIVKKTLKVKIYIGDGWHLDFSRTHFDSFSPPDFYTKIRIVGVPTDAAKKKTRIIDDDWAPSWDEEFEFPLTVPDLAVLRIEVREYNRSQKDDFGGQTCLPISEIKPGIRAIPLYDRNGEKLKSVKLLMQFQFV